MCYKKLCKYMTVYDCILFHFIQNVQKHTQLKQTKVQSKMQTNEPYSVKKET